MTAARAALIAALIAVAGAAAFAAWPAPATSSDRVERIASELRCPVCQGLSVADSQAETAREMRALVVQRVAEGRTDEEIREEFRRSYGDWVFLSPATEGPAALMWLLPLGLLALGATVAVSRARAPAEAVAEPSGAQIRELRGRVAREELADL